MNPHLLKRLFPRASKSVLEANACDYGSSNFNLNGSGATPKLERPDGNGSLETPQAEEWSESEIAELKAVYDKVFLDINGLSEKLGRSYASVTLKASKLGFTGERGRFKRTEETKAKMGLHFKALTHDERSKSMKANIEKYGHPKGFKGKHHSEESKGKMREKLAGKPSPPERVLKQLKTKAANGTLAPQNNGRTWKSGWREIGGKRIYARSRWEANYARWLEFQKGRGWIKEWEHEPETFWFEKIKRGSRSYLPDFRVTTTEDLIEYHETKGWMDSRSKTKIKRMKKYHPEVVLIVRDAQWFKANGSRLRSFIPEWESGR